MQRRFPLGGAIGLGAALMASTATAQDAEGGLRLVFGIEERLEYGRNLALAVPAEGSTSSAATTLSFGLYSSTPLDRLEFTASAALLVENAPDTDGTVTDGSYPQAIGGFSVIDTPSREDALKWAAKIAVACRCAQEVREVLPDPPGLEQHVVGARSAST